MATPDDLKRFHALMSESSLGSEAAEALISRVSQDEVVRATAEEWRSETDSQAWKDQPAATGEPSLRRSPVIKPLEDRMIVQPVRQEGSTSAVGLLVVEDDEEIRREGRVVAVGPGRWNEESHERVPMDVVVGDRIIFSKYGGTEIRPPGGDEYIILSARDVIAVVEKSAKEQEQS